MKKTAKRKPDPDEMRAEYDFASMKGGVRGKYYRRFQKGVNVALLEPDIAKAFPTDQDVNDALRTVLRAARALRRPRRLPTNGVQEAAARASKPPRS